MEQLRKRDRVLGIDKTKTELEESELDCAIVRLMAILLLNLFELSDLLSLLFLS